MKNIHAPRFGMPAVSPRETRAWLPALVLPACLFLLTGCLSRPALKTETFAFDLAALAGKPAPATAPVLGIKTISVAAPFADRPFVYRTGDFNYERDPYAEFLDFPGKLLAAPIRAGLGSQGDFRSVVLAGGLPEPDLWVEINISQLFGDFRVPGQAKAVLRAQFVFYQEAKSPASGVILQKDYSRTIPLAKPAAASLIAGWNQALNEILHDVLRDYRQRQQ